MSHVFSDKRVKHFSQLLHELSYNVPKHALPSALPHVKRLPTASDMIIKGIEQRGGGG